MTNVFPKASLTFLLFTFYSSSVPPVYSHPVPYSYLDLPLERDGVNAALVVHAIDLAHDLNLNPSELLLNPALAQAKRGAILDLIRSRLTLRTRDEVFQMELRDIEFLSDRQALLFRLRFTWQKQPGVFSIHCMLFPYDPNHQTFLAIYEGGGLTHQEILDRHHPDFEYYTGTRQGIAAVMEKFIPAGVRHIMIGPDHILFIIGLLLLGGGILRLVKIVSAFTLAHSVTLTLAALDLLSPPSRIIEPAIALSIIYVGADNLIAAKEGRDLRAWIALFFGFIHGFGFANVLKEFGLPRQALGWSLFSFNFGVEIGQVLIVAGVGFLLAGIRDRNPLLARRILLAGSAAVILAGSYWFVQRVFLRS